MVDTVKRYIFQLQSLEPKLRREAIVALSQAGDERAVEPLKRIAANDPDPELRALAADAEQRVERERNFLIPEQSTAHVPNDRLALAMPGRIEPTARDKRLAQQHLHQTFTFSDAGNREHAVYHLTLAIQHNPLLVYEKPARFLAADLMGAGDAPQQAIDVLLKRIKEGDIQVPPLRLMDADSRQTIERAALIAFALLLVMAVIFAQLAGKPLTLSAILYGIPQALLGLLSLVFADLLMFVVAIMLGGVSTVPRFLNGVLVAQLAIAALVAATIAFVPVASISTSKLADGSNFTLVTANTFSLLAAFSVNVFVQTTVVYRAMKITTDKAMLTVILGMAVTLIAAEFSGILQTIRIG